MCWRDKVKDAPLFVFFYFLCRHREEELPKSKPKQYHYEYIVTSIHSQCAEISPPAEIRKPLLGRSAIVSEITASKLAETPSLFRPIAAEVLHRLQPRRNSLSARSNRFQRKPTKPLRYHKDQSLPRFRLQPSRNPFSAPTEILRLQPINSRNPSLLGPIDSEIIPPPT